jgi:hypothetical protein
MCYFAIQIGKKKSTDVQKPQTIFFLHNSAGKLNTKRYTKDMLEIESEINFEMYTSAILSPI